MQRLWSNSRALSVKVNAESILISWDEFFKTRRKLQLFQRMAGVPFAFGFLFAEGMVLSLPIFDPTKSIFGLDPLLVVGLSTIAGITGSYLTGMAFTGFVWKRLRPEFAQQMNMKHKDFYSRVTKYRANVPPNPAQMNFSFDFYGEKVRSIADYREWLRRQYRMKQKIS